MKDLICIVLYSISIILMLISISWIVVRGGRGRLSYTFCLIQIMIIIWSIGQINLLSSVNDFQFFMSICISHIAICFIGTIWLIFSMLYSEIKIKALYIIIAFLISSFHFIMMLSTNFHHLFYKNISVDLVQYGPIFKTNAVYTYGCMILGTFLIISACFKRKQYSRGQGILLALAVLIPLLSNFLYIFHIVNFTVDITPLTFSVSSILVLLATYGYGFLNVNNIAFEGAVKVIDEGFIICKPNGKITYLNSSANDYIDGNNKFAVMEFLELIDDSKKLLNSKGVLYEVETKFKDKILNVKKYNYIGRNNDVSAFSIVIKDVSKYYELLKKSNELSALNTRLEIEKERNRIAQEIHDTAGHTLTMINTLAKVGKISMNKNDYEEVINCFDEVERLTSSSIYKLRNEINNMKKDKKFNCVSQGINELAYNTKGIDVEVTLQGEDGERYIFLSDIFYKCAREAITNSLRYSRAEKIDIIIKFLNNSAELYIIDNGDGCENIQIGNGLEGISKRVTAIGGKADFISRKNEGFQMRIIIPIRGEISD